MKLNKNIPFSNWFIRTIVVFLLGLLGYWVRSIWIDNVKPDGSNVIMTNVRKDSGNTNNYHNNGDVYHNSGAGQQNNNSGSGTLNVNNK